MLQKKKIKEKKLEEKKVIENNEHMKKGVLCADGGLGVCGEDPGGQRRLAAWRVERGKGWSACK